MVRQIAFALALLLITNCSSESSELSHERRDKVGENVEYCGYDFEEDTGAVSSLLSVLNGYWIEWTPNSCTSAKDSTGKEYCYKSGFQFDSFGSLFGEVTFKYDDVTDVATKTTFEITKPSFAKMRISKELSGAYAGYRLVQLEDGTGYIKCQNFAYKYDAKDKRLYYTQPKSIYGWTTEGVPNLEDFLKDNPTPGGAYRIRF